MWEDELKKKYLVRKIHCRLAEKSKPIVDSREKYEYAIKTFQSHRENFIPLTQKYL